MFGTRIAFSKCVSWRHERRSQEAAKRRWVTAKVIEFYVPREFKRRRDGSRPINAEK
jgi:hypothetical protein